MQHNAPPAAAKKSTAQQRDTWFFEDNTACSLLLISKRGVDEPFSFYEFLESAGTVIKKTAVTLFSKTENPDPAAIKVPDVIELPPENIAAARDIKLAIKERNAIYKKILACYKSKTAPDLEDVFKLKDLNDKLNVLKFGNDQASIKINDEFMEIERQILILRFDLDKVDERINKIKADCKTANKTKDEKKQALEPDNADRNLLIQKIDKLLVKKILMIRENIREHARRRVDIYFLLCVALWKTHLSVVNVTRAEAQLGKGQDILDTAACHASIIKNIIITRLPPPVAAVDTVIEKLKAIAETTEQAAGVISRFITNTPAPPPPPKPEPPKNPLDDFKYKDSYLEELLNITDDLPTTVNDLNCLMEGKFGNESPFTEICVDNLNSVARDELHPFEAMAKYGMVLRKFYETMDYKYLISKKNSSLLLYKEATKLIRQYESEGTFDAFKPGTNELSNDYIKLMLNLHEFSAGQKFLTFFSYDGYVNDKILETQKTLLTAEPMRKRIKEEREKWRYSKGGWIKVKIDKSQKKDENEISPPAQGLNK